LDLVVPDALSAARALIDIPDYDAERIGKPCFVKVLLTAKPFALLGSQQRSSAVTSYLWMALYNAVCFWLCLGLGAARKAMQIAADSCIYTNSNFTMEKIDMPSE